MPPPVRFEQARCIRAATSEAAQRLVRRAPVCPSESTGSPSACTRGWSAVAEHAASAVSERTWARGDRTPRSGPCQPFMSVPFAKDTVAHTTYSVRPRPLGVARLVRCPAAGDGRPMRLRSACSRRRSVLKLTRGRCGAAFSVLPERGVSPGSPASHANIFF